jgi:VWFA-related protein
MSMARIGILLTVAAIGISVFVSAQEPPKYKVDVNVVNVLATVRDRNGQFVSDLSKDDFILEEDGRPQEIRYFTRQTEMPLKIGLLIDTSMSQRSLIGEERSASYQFLDQVLRPDRDHAFVIRFDTEAELLQDLTNSRSLLQEALDGLDALSALRRLRKKSNDPNPLRASPQIWPGQRLPGTGRQGGPRPGPGGQPGMQGIGTVLFDSVFLASDEILRHQEGRKAIILISDGVDYNSKLSENDATEAAHYADAIIYSIRYFDPNVYSGPLGGGGNQGSRGIAVLAALSRKTGGRMFEVSRKLPLKEIYAQIQEELRNQYNLGYAPANTKGTAFRQIKLRTKDDKYRVQTRAGYYPRH